MWDQKVRRLTEERFKRRPQSPLRRSRARFREDQAPALPARETPADYAGIGAELGAERERRGLSLTDAASALHIQQRYLEAIEAGRFDDLPGSTYVTGFLRSYSRYLGADPAEVVAAFRRESSMPLGPTKLVAFEAIAEPRRPRATVVLVSLLAAAVLYAGWAYLNDDALEVSETVAPAPERLVSLLNAEDAAASATAGQPGAAGDASAAADTALPLAAERQPPVAALSEAAAAAAREAQRDADALVDAAPAKALDPQTPAAPPAQSPAAPGGRPVGPQPEAEPSEDVPPETPALETVELAPPAPPVPQPSPVANSDAAVPPPPPPGTGGGSYLPQRFGGGDTDARVVVRAKVDSWVQIQGGRNETLLTRILRPGDTFYAPNRGDLMLTTGNVGGLEIIVDGEPLGPLGPMGAVRRNISLDAEKLLAMAGAREQRR